MLSLPSCRPVTSPPKHSSAVAQSSHVVAIFARHPPHSRATLASMTLPRAARATVHACKHACTHSSMGRLRIPSPTHHCICSFTLTRMLHFPLPPLPPSSLHCHPTATHHRSSHQRSQWKHARSLVLPHPTSSPESQRADHSLAFPRRSWTVPPPPLCWIRRRPVSPLLPSSSKSYPRLWHTSLTSHSSFLVIGSSPLRAAVRHWRWATIDRHVVAPSASTSVPKSFPEYPCHSSLNIESYTSPPLCRSPPSAAATPVRMRHRPSARLPGGSPCAQSCHARPPSPIDAVTVAPVTSRSSGSRSWPRPACGDHAKRARHRAPARPAVPFWPVGQAGAKWPWAE
jgi:hypothetical protein